MATLTADEIFRIRHTFPTISHSSISSFLWNKEDWYQCYVKVKKTTSPELEFGKKVADSMGTKNPLAPFTRLKEIEHEFDVVFAGIRIVGSMDTHERSANLKVRKHRNGEFKTGVKPWDQKRVDEHKQLTMYSFLLWHQEKIRPEDTEWFLEWARTIKEETGDFKVTIRFPKPIEIKHFKTKRTMVDILKFGAEIKKVHKEMLEYVKNHE